MESWLPGVLGKKCTKKVYKFQNKYNTVVISSCKQTRDSRVRARNSAFKFLKAFRCKIKLILYSDRAKISQQKYNLKLILP